VFVVVPAVLVSVPVTVPAALLLNVPALLTVPVMVRLLLAVPLLIRLPVTVPELVNVAALVTFDVMLPVAAIASAPASTIVAPV
jgi:hypothetical protein